MNRYAQLFSRLDEANQGAFVPFVMLGDPTPELSLAIVDALVEGGADALELGDHLGMAAQQLQDQ